MKKIALVAALAFAGTAQAASVSYTDTFGLATTNWTHTLTLSQFNDLGGTLTLDSVLFEYDGRIDSTIRVESLDAAPATVSGNTAGTLVFGVPVGGNLNIASSQSVVLTAFDLVVDFGGTSGHDFGTISGTAANTLLLNSGLGSYIGLGTYGVITTATGASNANGAGNLVAIIGTQALANLKVTYTYHDTPTHQVPEPATLGLLGLGLLGLGAMRRRKAA